MDYIKHPLPKSLCDTCTDDYWECEGRPKRDNIHGVVIECKKHVSRETNRKN